MNASDLRLPGVYFLPPPELERPELPRLDVAAFIGFAERGPLHLPVAIDDPGIYREIFGGDLALAREAGGRLDYAHMPGAVRQFFANGGRRCYVVRVAGDGAARARFRMPGLVDLSAEPRLAQVEASWPGRWAEGLGLGTRLRLAPLPSGLFSLDGPRRLSLPLSGEFRFAPGDLLQLNLDDETYLFPVSAISIQGDAANPRLILDSEGAWELVCQAGSPPPFVEAVMLLHTGEPEALEVELLGLENDAGGLSLTLEGLGAAQVRQGDVLWLRQGSEGGFLFPVEALDSHASGSIQASAATMLRLPATDLPLGSPQAALSRMFGFSFDLQIKELDAYYPAIESLAFNQGGERYWGEAVYLLSSPLVRRASTALTGAQFEATASVFNLLLQGTRLPDDALTLADIAPLAARLAPLQALSAARLFLPLGMPDILEAGGFRGPEEDHTGLDGLDSLDLAVFADPSLVGGVGRSTHRTLLSAAFERYYNQGRRLRGLHSLLFLDEVALVAIPDAAHLPWALDSLGLQPDPFKPWATQASQGTDFLICQGPPQVIRIQPPQGTTLGGTQVTINGLGFTASEQSAVWFGTSPAGDVSVSSTTTLTCTAPPHSKGLVDITVGNWNGARSLEQAFLYVEPLEARLPLLSSPLDYTESPLRRLQRWLIDFCQARQDAVAILHVPQHYSRRECLAWLEALRQDFGLPPQPAYQDDARQMVDLSYAAVYHPWLLVASPSEPGGMRPTPSDGAVCGQIALRERRRQVWVAPANQPLQGVLGLDPALTTAEAAELFDRQFNLLRREASEFRPVSAHTLSDARQLLQLSVRRLMILLRKVALERGMDYVFESNDEGFRNSVQFSLEEMLQGLYQRGAFSGASPRNAFRVTTGSSLNTPQDLDNGRFIAQIQVAPSQPLEFITVLLLRAGDGALQALER